MELEGSDYDDIQSVKIVFLGDRSVGKTSIIRRFITGEFDEKQNTTVGIDYMFKTIPFRGLRYKLELWDTAGQQKYRSLVKTYLKNADCCVYVHDVNDLISYHHIVQWMNILQESNCQDCLQIIAGNKVDSKVEGFQKQASNFKLLYNKESARLSKYTHVEVSAKERTNIGQLFETLLTKLVDQRHLKVNKKTSQKMLIQKPQPVKKSSCCGIL